MMMWGRIRGLRAKPKISFFPGRSPWTRATAARVPMIVAEVVVKKVIRRLKSVAAIQLGSLKYSPHRFNVSPRATTDVGGTAEQTVPGDLTRSYGGRVKPDGDPFKDDIVEIGMSISVGRTRKNRMGRIIAPAASLPSTRDGNAAGRQYHERQQHMCHGYDQRRLRYRSSSSLLR